MIERVVFLDRSAIPAAFRLPKFPHVGHKHADTPAELVVERLREATIATTNRVSLKEENLAQLPNLRFIAVAATGYDIVDVDACNHLGIFVSNIRNWCTTSVAEHVFALTFALRRKLFEVRDHIRSGAWQRSQGPLMPILPPPLEIRTRTDTTLQCKAAASIWIVPLGTQVASRIAHFHAIAVRWRTLDAAE